MLGNTLSDADYERDLGLESLLDTSGGNGGTRFLSGLIREIPTRYTYGTKRAVAVAPVSLTASDTFLKTGRSR